MKSALYLLLILILLHSSSNYCQTKKVESLQNIHKTYNDLLKDFVKKGMVNYKEMRADKRLEEYTKILSGVDPDRLTSSNEKLAFWINAYNAFTLKIVCDNYPVESIVDIGSGGLVVGHVLSTTVWDKDFIIINKKNYSLNDIEHKIIREKFKEPRIHFALVCASISCPPLRNEAFTAEKLDDQLNDQAKTFLNDNSKNVFNQKNHEAKISKLFDWYGDDFGENEEQLLKYFAKYLSEKIADDLKKYSAKWKIDYLDYNWNLNELK